MLVVGAALTEFLLYQVDKKNWNVVPTLLALGASAADQDHAGFSALHLAVARQSPDTVALLLANKAIVNTEAQTSGILPSISPLGTACRSRSTELIQLLLDAKATLDACGAAHLVAASADCPTSAQLLSNANLCSVVNMDGCGILHAAASNGSLMRTVLAAICTEEAEKAATRRNNAGITPLMMAASVASDGSVGLDALKQLLQLGGQHGGARVQDYAGNTALHHTEDLTECSEVVSALVGAGGAEIQEIVNKAGQKPMIGLGQECPMQ